MKGLDLTVASLKFPVNSQVFWGMDRESPFDPKERSEGHSYF